MKNLCLIALTLGLMAQVFPSRAQALYEEGKVSVISHRGDWRNTPENSIRAIQNCIDLGVNRKSP